MNTIVITGRLTRDPELQTLKNGMEKCRFTVAVDRAKKKDQPQRADFFNCDAWGATSGFVMKWFRKGSPITVKGRMESGQVEKNGEKVTYWSLNVDNVEFQMAKKDDFQPDAAPETDNDTGMEVVTVELPF